MATFDPRTWAKGIKNAARGAAVKGLAMAGRAMVEDVRSRIDVQGPPRSRPGDPPHMETQNLWKSIHFEVDEAHLKVYVIADTPYAYYLEYGTARMAPRPYMRPSLAGIASDGPRALSRFVSVAFAPPRSPVDPSRVN